MRIVIDGLPLLGEATIGSYLRQLLFHLFALDGRHEYRLFFRAFRAETRVRIRHLLGDSAMSPFQVTIARVPDRLLEWCWIHSSIRLPLTESWLGRPDLFLSTVYMTPVMSRVPSVMMAYDLIPILFPSWYGSDQPLLRSQIRRSVERASTIIAISKRTKQDYVELLGADPERIHVVYPGIDARFCQEHDAARLAGTLRAYGIQRPYILYIGVLAPHKNLEMLVRVFRRLKQTNSIPHQLVLCGRARWGQHVIKAAGDLIATGDCLVLDHVPASDVPFLYQGAEVFAFLSLYEGFGLPPVEAMACGTPVIVSNAGALQEAVGDAALQVSPTDEEAIAHALLRILDDDDLQEQLRIRGFHQAKKFAWSKSAQQTLSIFSTVGGAA